MAAVLVCVAVVLGIYPADRTVWCVEMVWAVVMGCVWTLPNGLLLAADRRDGGTG